MITNHHKTLTNVIYKNKSTIKKADTSTKDGWNTGIGWGIGPQ